MRSLYLRVWLTVVLVLALFAMASGWLAQRHLNQERERLVQLGGAGERLRAMAELIGQALPDPEEATDQQAAALQHWAERLRLPLALNDARGQRIAASPSFERRLTDPSTPAPVAVPLEDGRTLWMMRVARPNGERRGGTVGTAAADRGDGAVTPAWRLAWATMDPVRSGGGLVMVLALLFLAVALGAYPVVRRLTRRLEALQQGVERLGSGTLGHRVDDHGHDEVARLAAAFNRAAERIESLLQSNSRLVANASHELRSPLARLKVALGLWEDMHDETARRRLRQEIDHNLRELDTLIEELLLSSRLQAQSAQSGLTAGSSSCAAAVGTPFDLLATVAEEASRAGAELTQADGVSWVLGEERLIRRAVRNLLDNAARYGQGAVEVALRQVSLDGRPGVELQVLDRGPGVPAHETQRIFEPFYRLPGHAESEGGVGLGLALVQQIAQHHGGHAEVRAREGGGSCFAIRLPQAVPPPPSATNVTGS